jgi:hypothetical protein
MNLLNSALNNVGDLVLSIPCALLVLLSREWYAARMSGDKESVPLMDFSLISFASLSLNGAAPGGLLSDKPYALLRFLHGQLWLTILLGLGIVYVLLKGPGSETFAGRFSAIYLTQVWALLLFNFIPVPPFDASIIYFSPYMQWKMFTVMTGVLGFITLILFSYGFWRVDFLTGRFLLEK